MKHRIKVLQLTASLAVGGAEVIILNLARRLDRARFETHVCHLGQVRSNSLQPEFERLGVPVYSTGSRKLYSVTNIRAVQSYVQEHQIDLIHTHLLNADIVGRLVGRWTGRPVISTLHNIPFNYNRSRWDRRWLERLTARYLANRLIAVSRHIGDRFIQEWSIPAERISPIYNAVDLEPFLAIAPGVDPATSRGPVITNIASLSQQKAQDKLLEGARHVLQQHPDARFKIVGRGRLEAKLKSYAENLGIAGQVEFTGLRHDIPEILAQTDIFVLSSLWEGLPLAAIEAMAAARPVVLTDVGGNHELVTSGQEGLLVPPGDVPALAAALQNLIDDPAYRNRLGRNARARVREEFSLERMMGEHERLYETVWRESVNGQTVAQVQQGAL